MTRLNPRLTVKRLAMLLFAGALAFWLSPAPPALALNLAEFFSYSYSAEFTKSEVKAGESFSIVVTAQATCGSDLIQIFNFSQATATGRIVAEHQVSGGRVTLNPAYTTTIPSVPSRAGESVQVSQDVRLQFPSGSLPGDYAIIGELIEAKIKSGSDWISLSRYLPPSTRLGTVKVTQETVPGGGAALPKPPPVMTPASGLDVSGYIGADGRFARTLAAQSADKGCTLTIWAGTSARAPDGVPIGRVSISSAAQHQPAQQYVAIISAVYELGPSGTIFDPPVEITLPFPEGAAGRVSVGTWDEAEKVWRALRSKLENGTATAEVEHLSQFAVISGTRPAEFVWRSLLVMPAEASHEETVTVKVVVANSGDMPGTNPLTLNIDGRAAETREVALDGGAEQEVIFAIAAAEAGLHTVSIGNLSGYFTVAPAPTPPHTENPIIEPVPSPAIFSVSELSVVPSQVKAGETVAISALVTNSGGQPGTFRAALIINGEQSGSREVSLAAGARERVTFTAAAGAPGTYAVTIGSLEGEFTVLAAPAPASSTPSTPDVPASTNWWGVGGVVVGAVAIAAGAGLALRRKARRG